MQADDAYWRRPADGSDSADPVWQPGGPGPAGGHPGTGPDHQGLTPHYQGPPPTNPPPAGWRPPHVVEPTPPRQLPEQNHAAIDDQEARARTLSLGLAIVTGAVLVIILCAVCGRTLF